MQSRLVVSMFGRKRLSFLVLIALGLFIFLLPEAARAERCQTYHWVKEGETRAYIAKTYGFKWRELAEANGLDLYKRPEVGLRLCIPPEKQTQKPALPKSEKAAQISMFINGDRVYITVDRYMSLHAYRVKARSTRMGQGGWHNLGFMETPENMAQSFVFDVPSELRSLPSLSVCLKDLQSNELLCRKVIYPH